MNTSPHARWRPPGPGTLLLAALLLASIADGAAHANATAGSAAPVIPRGLPPDIHPSSSVAPPRGVTLGINGAILSGLGATFMGLGAVALAEGASCVRTCGFWEQTSGPLLLALGAPAFVVGFPLFAVGVHRHRRWRAWERRRMFELRPRLGRVLGGATAGVALRF